MHYVAVCFYVMTFSALFTQLSSSNFLRPSGSRRAAVSSSRDAVVVNSETDPSQPVSLDALLSGSLRKIDNERSSPIISSEQNRTSSGKRAANVSAYESTLRGMQSLRFK